MNKSHFSQAERFEPAGRNRRRPAGVSRRQKKRQLGFETLEDRRVMSADPLAPIVGPTAQTEFITYSSDTPEGLAATLAAELARYQFISTHNDVADLRGRSIPTDPLFEDQWYLLNVGQEVQNPVLQQIFGTPGEDINYFDARQLGYTGEGVTVAVIDSGVQQAHPDLNLHPTLQFDAIALDGDANPVLFPFDPDFPFTTYDPTNAHGTAVAGIIAALDDGVGTVGIAPDALIIPIRNDFGVSPAANVEAFQFATQNADITNNSWGPADGLRQLAAPSPAELLSLQNSIFGPNAGRNGLGMIHVFAAGNGADVGAPGDVVAPGLDSASYDGYVNSRYTIGVTGIDHDGEYNNIDGTITNFAEAGPSVLVAAHVGSFSETIGDDVFIGTGIASTDTLNSTGYNVPPASNGLEIDGDYLIVEDDAYTRNFGGTSAAAPQVSAVIALMLQANPNLGWRDVQEILIRSARQNAPTATLANGFDKITANNYQNPWIINQIPLFHEPDIYDPLIPNSIQFYNPELDPRIGNPGFIGLHAHYGPTPQIMTNGAGYTISQGRGTNFDQTGTAHGVVDAGLAVRLAEQWSSKAQTLPNELTFTSTADTPIPAGGLNNNIPAAHVVDPDGVALIIPGFLGGGGDWQGYYDEYFADAPDFTQFDNLSHGAPLELTVPQINGQDIVVETVEVLLNIGGGTKEALDHLRVVLVSPNGTHSELNHYFIDEGFPETQFHQTRGQLFNPSTGFQNLNPGGLNGVSADGVDRLSPTPDQGDTLVFNFTTNRAWGERSDDAIIYDPTTNEPFTTIPGLGGNVYNTFLTGAGVPSSVGDLVSSGWQLHFENYGNNDLVLNSVEIVWHGSPIQATTERVTGFVGIDQDQSDTFNFSRIAQLPAQSAVDFTDVDGDPFTQRLGEVVNIVDPNPEPFAANVTVFAFRDGNANGIVDGSDFLVDQFVTGHDGNYFFDLEPGDYIITTDDEQTFDDELTAEGFLRDFQTTWRITEDFFKVWDYDANLEVPTTIIDGVPTPSAFLDGNEVEVVTGIRNLNFLIDPGPEPDTTVDFSGAIFADFEGDGVFNGDDIAVPDIGVFADVNRNGQFDAGETLVETGIDGQYQLTVPTVGRNVIDIGVITPVDWEVVEPGEEIATFFTNGVPGTLNLDPINKTYTFFVEQGDVVTSVDFAVQPPVASDGSGGTDPTGTIFGTVFNDANSNTVRDINEQGVANITVYVDANNSGSLEPGELTALTNVNGAYVFSGVPAGDHLLRINIAEPLSQTVPINNNPRAVTVAPSGTITGVLFGIDNSAEFDWGDLPAEYNLTTAEDNGARSRNTGVYKLGEYIDAELDGIESDGAIGDDLDMFPPNDEDGVVVVPLEIGPQEPGATGQVTLTTNRFGGFLHGWIDFNGDFDFEDPGEQLILSSPDRAPTTSYGAVLGDNVLTFDLPDEIPDPATTAAGSIYARFRYGSFNIGISGEDTIGEVVDLVVDVESDTSTASLVNGSDINQDGSISGADFLAWQMGAGMTSGAVQSDGDANQDGAVDSHDLQMWQEAYNPAPPNPATFVDNTGDIDSDGDIDGKDFLALQRGFGMAEIATLSDGDGNHDGDVDLSDVQLWAVSYGFVSSNSSAAASQAVAGALSAPSGAESSYETAPASYQTAPRISQPGFREDYVPSEIDSKEAGSLIENQSIASIANAAERMAARTRGGRSAFARLDNQFAAESSGYVSHQAEAALARRDRVLEQLFAKRDQTLKEIATESTDSTDALEVLALALGEEIDWRL